MTKSRIILSILLLFSCLLLIAGCRDADLDPIFYTLENEEPIVDRGLDNEISVTQVVTDTVNSDYYAAAGKIYTRGTGGGDWAAVSIPAGSMCTVLAYAGGDLFAGLSDRSDGSGMGLWRKTLPAGAWTQDGDISSTAEVTMLKVAGQLFVSTLESQVGKLYYDNGGTFTAIPLPFSDPQVFVRDIAYDGSSEYWLAAGSNLLNSTNLGVGFSDAIIGKPTGVEFRGVHYASTGGAGNLPLGFYVSVYDVSGADGRIHHYNGAWTASADVSTTFTEFLEADNDRLWVGTLGGGYYDLQGDNLTDLFASIADKREPDNTISELYNGAVTRFASGTGTTIFACTSLAGLWVTQNLGDSWSRE
jgi:hypothetical protein